MTKARAAMATPTLKIPTTSKWRKPSFSDSPLNVDTCKSNILTHLWWCWRLTISRNIILKNNLAVISTNGQVFSQRILLNIIVFPRQYGQYDYSQPMGYASPGMMQPQQPYTGQIFQPTQTYTPSPSQSMYSSSFDDEPPLLEGRWTTTSLDSFPSVITSH